MYIVLIIYNFDQSREWCESEGVISLLLKWSVCYIKMIGQTAGAWGLGGVHNWCHIFLLTFWPLLPPCHLFHITIRTAVVAMAWIAWHWPGLLAAKEIQIILRLFIVIACSVKPVQASLINHLTSHFASWLGRKPTLEFWIDDESK